MVNLRVVTYCTAEEQSKQLRSLLISLKAENLSENANSDPTEDVKELLKSLSVINSLHNDQDIELALDSFITLLISARQEEIEDLVEKTCESLLSEKFQGRDVVLLHVLSNMFYMFSEISRLQYRLYCAMLTIAARSGLVRSLITDLNRVKEWFEKWNLSMDEKQACLRLLHAAFSKSQQGDELAKVMFELLSTYTTDTDAVNAKDDAKECVKSALADPGTFIFDHLLALKPVQSLSGDRIFELLQIFVSGSFSDYEKFYAKNSDYIEAQLKLSHAALTQKIRILTLTTMCQNCTEVPLKQIAAALKLNMDEELDDFIIKAVHSRAIRAKIDQINNRLIVGGVKNREFATQQWEQLRCKLDSWASSLRQVKHYLEDVIAVEN